MRKVTMILTISITLTILFIAGFPRSGGAQQMKQQLVGTWTLVDVYFEWRDGRKTQSYGPNVNGRLWIDPNGLFGLQVIGADRPKFKSSNRREGTAEENATVVAMTETFFGTYTLNDAERSGADHNHAS